MDSDNYRRLIVHRVFTGVHYDNPDLVSNALGEFEVITFRRGWRAGYLQGVAVGGILVALSAIFLLVF